MLNPILSIIIPVYNAADYLQDCIESIISQTFGDCEFIFINDGSTDNSQSVLEKYLERDSRIILINQKNKGVSEARNRGLTIAKGKYIGFVDADDWVEKEMYQILFDEMESSNCDLVVCNIKRNFNGTEHISRYNFPTDKVLGLDEIQNELLPYLIKTDDLYSSCNKLFKASIIKEWNIIFPPKNALSEDNIFNMLYFNKMSSFKYIDYSGYNYREVEGSATRNILKKDYFQNVLQLFMFDYRFYMDLKQTDEEIFKLKSEKLINSVISLIHLYFHPTKQMGFVKRYSYIKAMINNEDVQAAIKNNFGQFFENKNKYERFILRSIKDKSTIKLYLATSYSRFRN
ncbi:glycosyltransferase [Flavobacterium sp. GT3R68]|uniref:glycosyltransferase n=1 Tax=Flavobacterium sp. GT3R68 TaxID=2594437 RepID=UPI000F8799EA|nr:glycosyltransferase [Flavobacterium sp. GT3R68]RTY92305.1 glycosyltransferase [Flavobacterium sp. GSN2]TRW92541.1 glycosyltransferase [Flavobacterium sp. GT3R68]